MSTPPSAMNSFSNSEEIFQFSDEETKRKTNLYTENNSTSPLIARGYCSTIQLLLNSNQPKLIQTAFEQLKQAEEDGVFNKEYESRANLYKDVIEKLVEYDDIENNFLKNAYELHIEGQNKEVWKDYPVLALLVDATLAKCFDIIKQRGIIPAAKLLELAIEPLKQAEIDKVSEEEPETYANFYKDAIEKLIQFDNIENNLLKNAYELYTEGQSKQIWKDYPALASHIDDAIARRFDALKQRGIISDSK